MTRCRPRTIDTDALKRMWDSNMGVYAIADRLGLRRRTIRAKLCELGLIAK